MNAQKGRRVRAGLGLKLWFSGLGFRELRFEVQGRTKITDFGPSLVFWPGSYEEKMSKFKACCYN